MKRLIKAGIFQYHYRLRNIKFYFLKKKNNTYLKEVQGSKMLLDLSDKGISKDLALDGIREPESTKIIPEMVKQGNIIIEIGANIGYYAFIESRLVGQEGKIYAIEPSPSNFAKLVKNIKLNNYKNIECFQIGIGDRKTKAKMYVSTHSNLNSLFYQKNRPILRTIKINILSLDEFLKDKSNPDFIRMDVEGYEYFILQGMKNTLKSKHPMKIFIELHPHIMRKQQTTSVLNKLMENGFEIKKCFRCFTNPEMKVMSEEDYDYSNLTIKEMLDNEKIITGEKGAFEIFFERR